MVSFFFRLLVVALLCAASPSSGVRVATVPCNGTIPIDSQYNLGSIWSLATFRRKIVRLSGGIMRFREQSVDGAEKSRLVMESGLNADSIVVFEVAPTAASASGSASSLAGSPLCSVTIDPLRGAMDGTVSRGARFFVVSARETDGAVCSLPFDVSLADSSGRSSIRLSFDGTETIFSESAIFGVVNQATWPLTASFNSQCTLQFILLVDRYGAINRWYVWIPTTVYTAVIVALFLPVIALRQRLPVHLAGLFLFLAFLGFLGSCIGLVIELLQWQSALGRMFPFPPSVTLYSCLCVLYVLLFFPALYRRGDYILLLMGAARLFTYGLNCALCVGYWVAGYVVLGSLAIFQLLATNFILTWYYAYVTVHLRRADRGTSSLPRFSNNFIYMWCVPVTPFACCALLYYDIFLLAQRDVKRDACAKRLRDVVRIYNAQMSLPLLFFQNVYGVALLATAAAFHMPLVVLLFVALLLWMVHIIYAAGEYCREWSRWRRRGGSFSSCGFISLAAVMHFLLTDGVGGASSHPLSSQLFSQAVSPSPDSVRRRGHADQYEEDLAGYRNSHLSSSSTSDDDSRDAYLQLSSHRPIPEQSVAFSTPSRQALNDAPEYWPSSVER